LDRSYAATDTKTEVRCSTARLFDPDEAPCFSAADQGSSEVPRRSPAQMISTTALANSGLRQIIFGMSRPLRIPERGDVAKTLIAHRLGLSVSDFELMRPELERRDFPLPDPTTGRYCIEAVDRWRCLRHPRLFPELTATPAATHAETVFHERMHRLRG
jgi:hypothetical protein